MIKVSNSYKYAMDKSLRDRSYINVEIGIISSDAQNNAYIESSQAYWSKGNIFSNYIGKVEYATLEENFLKADGSMYFLPENTNNIQLLNNGVASSDLMQPIIISFSKIVSIKGLTIDFGDNYPTVFIIESDEKAYEYSNNSSNFITLDIIGYTQTLTITPISMLDGNNKRLRIKKITFGVGLSYDNNQIKDFSISENVSSISQELPSNILDFSFFDEDNFYNVDDDNSFINYLEAMQKISVSFGVTLDNKSVEWYKISTMFLREWKTHNGVVSISATDRMSQMEEEYSLSGKMYKRTAYEEAENIFADAGLEPDEYYIDDYLKDVSLINPIPEGTHKECLQLLANACRCILKQDENGRIIIRANFATTLIPSDITVNTNGCAPWSNPINVNTGTYVLYSDLTQNFLKADGSMYFLPENTNYLETSYVSSQISDENGLFDTNPILDIEMSASYTYFGVNILFDGNEPEEIIVRTYRSNELISQNTFSIYEKDSYLDYEFSDFDKMSFEFTKSKPYNRILVNKISFGDTSDYVLRKNDMFSNPVGYKDKRIKAVKCRIYEYKLKNDKAELESDGRWYESRIGDIGDVKIIQNPLIDSEEKAKQVSNWIANYYSDNTYYDVDYRGDIRNNASDIIHMDSEILNNLQVEIKNHTLNFNGAFSGSMQLKRVFKPVLYDGYVGGEYNDKGSADIDDQLSDTSTNPVQNKVITNKITQIEASIPTVDEALSATSTNAIQNKAVYEALKNIGGGSGVEKIEYTTLLEKDVYTQVITTVPYISYDLTDKISNYDLIKIVGSYYSSRGVEQFVCDYWTPEDLFTYQSTISGDEYWRFIMVTSTDTQTRRIAYAFEAGEGVDKFLLTRTQNMAISSIYGMKFVSNSGNVKDEIIETFEKTNEEVEALKGYFGGIKFTIKENGIVNVSLQESE